MTRLCDNGEGLRSTPPGSLEARIVVLENLIRRASAFVNGIAVLADNKGPALGWLADAEIAMPGEILGDPDGPIDESDHDHS